MTSNETIFKLGTICYSAPSDIDDYATSDSENLTPELREALKRVEYCIHHMNDALRAATRAGAIVELRRSSRTHSGDGCWADQMAPLVSLKTRDFS